MKRSILRPALSWACVCTAAWLVAMSLVACGNSPPTARDSTPRGAAVEEASELADGTYSCDATNTSRGYGPYSLECDKSGDTITLHFSNGGHIDLDIDSQESAGGGTWEIETTSSENGDSWSVTIDE